MKSKHKILLQTGKSIEIVIDGQTLSIPAPHVLTDPEMRELEAWWSVNRREIHRRIVIEATGLFRAELEQSNDPLGEPPLAAQSILAFVGDRKTVDAMLGDMQERFNVDANKHGDLYARRRYWQEVLRSIAPSIWRRIRQASVLGIVIGYVRSKLGW